VAEVVAGLASPGPNGSAVIGSPGPACDVRGGPRSPQEAGSVLGRLQVALRRMRRADAQWARRGDPDAA